MPKTIRENLTRIRKSIPEGVAVVAISKMMPESAVMEAYDAGQRAFGENRHAELERKHAALPKDIEWHFIGHLQTNKVRYIAPIVSMIHSVDSERLLATIDKEAAKAERVIDVLFEVFIARDETKSGWEKEQLLDYLRKETYKDLKNIRIRGVMGMATYTSDTAQVSAEFASLKSLFDAMKSEFFATDNNFDTISMGMSGDYKIAIAAGATMVRIGSSIFR